MFPGAVLFEHHLTNSEGRITLHNYKLEATVFAKKEGNKDNFYLCDISPSRIHCQREATQSVSIGISQNPQPHQHPGTNSSILSMFKLMFISPCFTKSYHVSVCFQLNETNTHFYFCVLECVQSEFEANELKSNRTLNWCLTTTFWTYNNALGCHR